MMKRICLLLVCALFFSSGMKAQSYYNDLIRDRVTVNTDEGTIVAFTKEEKGIEAEPGKEYFWFRAGKILSTYGGYDGKVLTGLFSSYYPDHNLKEKGQFKNGLKTGEWRTWYPDGKIKEIANWKNGLRKGSFLQYDPEGRMIKRGVYKNGQPDGVFIDDSDPDNSKTTVYRKGKVAESTNKGQQTQNARSKGLKARLNRLYKRVLKKKKENSVVKRE